MSHIADLVQAVNRLAATVELHFAGQPFVPPLPEPPVSLLPCPFCGNEELLRVSSGIEDFWFVRCASSCDTKGPVRIGERNAIDAWNRRPTAVNVVTDRDQPCTAKHPCRSCREQRL